MRRAWVLVGLLLTGCGFSAIGTPTAMIAAPVSGFGHRVSNGGIGITVNSIADPLTPGTTAPKSNNRFVAVDFTLENLGTKDLTYNVTGAILRTSDDRQYQYGFAGNAQPEPFFNFGTANPGDKIRGWVVFEIPMDAKIVGFRYQHLREPLIVVTLT